MAVAFSTAFIILIALLILGFTSFFLSPNSAALTHEVSGYSLFYYLPIKT